MKSQVEFRLIWCKRCTGPLRSSNSAAYVKGPKQSCSVGKLRWESALLPLKPGPYWKQRPVLPLACVQDTVILGLPLSTAKLLGLNKVEISFFHHLSDWRSSRPEWGHQSGPRWLPWFRLAIDSQNKTRNGFTSTTKTWLRSMVIWHPTLNIKSGFPQNMIWGNLFSLLRVSDLKKCWDRRGRGNIF